MAETKKLKANPKPVKLTDREEQIVSKIAEENNITWLEARELFLKAKKEQEQKKEKTPETTEKTLEQEKKEEEHKHQEEEKSQQEAKEQPKKRRIMKVKETKLGVTIVISKEECEKIGINPEITTREAIKQIKQKLGL